MSILTTQQIVELTGWSKQKVQLLCKSGRLPSTDTSTGGKRPRYAIRLEDLEAFLTPASVAKTEAKKVVSRRRIDVGVPKVFG